MPVNNCLSTKTKPKTPSFLVPSEKLRQSRLDSWIEIVKYLEKLSIFLRFTNVLTTFLENPTGSDFLKKSLRIFSPGVEKSVVNHRFCLHIKHCLKFNHHLKKERHLQILTRYRRNRLKRKWYYKSPLN